MNAEKGKVAEDSDFKKQTYLVPFINAFIQLCK